jgi:hypothetical protein
MTFYAKKHGNMTTERHMNGRKVKISTIIFSVGMPVFMLHCHFVFLTAQESPF